MRSGFAFHWKESRDTQYLRRIPYALKPLTHSFHLVTSEGLSPGVDLEAPDYENINGPGWSSSQVSTSPGYHAAEPVSPTEECPDNTRALEGATEKP